LITLLAGNMYIYKFGSPGHMQFTRGHSQYVCLIVFLNLEPRHYEISQAPRLW